MNQKNIKIKYIADLYTGNSIPDSDKDKYVGRELPYISSKDINVDNNKIDYDNGMSTNISDGFKIASSNSVLLCIEGGSAGRKIAYLNKDVSFVNKLCCFKSKNVDSKYLYYSLKADSFTSRFNEMLNGMIGGVSIYNLNNIKIPIVDKKFQEIITKYLDKHIDNIDKSIENETKLINELQCYKKSLVTEAVTKGLNRNANLKNSGSTWIGKISSDFEIVRLKYCLEDYADGTHGTYNRVDEGEPLLSAKNVLETGLNITNFESMISKKDYQSIISNGFPKKGDILLCCVGTIGRCIIFNENKPYAFQRSVIMLRTNKKIYNKYLYYFMNSKCALGQEKAMANQSAQEGIYQESVKEIKVVLPSIDNQKKIADFLDKKCPSIDKLIELKETKIELLNKYKRSLIYEYVTGKRKINV